jgi:hypothetical protein
MFNDLAHASHNYSISFVLTLFGTWYFYTRASSYLGQGTTPLLVHVLNPYANCPPVSLELLHLGQLHHSSANVPQSFSRQVGASYVLDERAEVDT